MPRRIARKTESAALNKALRLAEVAKAKQSRGEMPHPVAQRLIEKAIREEFPVTAKDVEYADLQREMSEAEVCPNPARIEFRKRVLRDAKIEYTQRVGFREGKEPRLSAKASAERAIADPGRYPRMTAEEVMAYLCLSPSAVYEHRKLERVSTGGRAVRFTTLSVKAIIDSSAHG
jgi:hypothetical protein